MPQDSVKSLMSQGVISVLPETLVLTAIDILLTNNYNGIPVTDKTGVIIGILTKYDLIVKRGSIMDDTKVKDVMNNDPLTLSEDMTVEDAVRAFSEHHKVDPIPVVDSDKKVIGVISRYDMVKMFREYGPAFGVKNANTSPKKDSGANYFTLVIIVLAIIVLGGALYYLGYV